MTAQQVSICELGRRTGLSVSSISGYRKGRVPNAANLAKVAAALGTTVDAVTAACRRSAA